MGNLAAKYSGQGFTAAREAQAKAEGAVVTKGMTTTTLHFPDGSSVEVMIDRSEERVMVAMKERMHGVVIELVRAQSALNSPTPETCSSEMVRDAYAHIEAALKCVHDGNREGK